MEVHGAEIHTAACGQALREAAVHGEEPVLEHVCAEGLQPMGNEHAEAGEIFENDGGIDGKSHRLRTTSISLPLCVALVGEGRKVRNEGVKLNLGIHGEGE